MAASAQRLQAVTHSAQQTEGALRDELAKLGGELRAVQVLPLRPARARARIRLACSRSSETSRWSHCVLVRGALCS